MSKPELTIEIPEDIGEGTFKIRGEMTRQILDKLNRINYQKEFAHDNKDVDKLVELDNQIMDLTLIEMIVEPKVTREMLRTNQISFQVQQYLQNEIGKQTILTPERMQDLKKKPTMP